jgi:uncharacterized protein YdeI (BOF family)
MMFRFLAMLSLVIAAEALAAKPKGVAVKAAPVAAKAGFSNPFAKKSAPAPVQAVSKAVASKAVSSGDYEDEVRRNTAKYCEI